ncbi:hypothetical protein DERP_015034 [Dermatophagoides pteronyssinus]|uniref:Serine--tRNA synthetase-like protein Slimp n=1 Tax=Dermatophagoides pteronyssinus TaxID=6956 RepID=A0ABQ8JD19_DERPT|nr:hypothetical protein DERP_015034 [Dermatophagoides pteronyssinus]
MLFNKLSAQTFRRYIFVLNNNNLKNCSTLSSSSSLQSSLYVSAKYAKELFRVLDPKYDVNYLNYVRQNLDKIEQSFRIRNIENNYFNNPKLSDSLNDFIKHLTTTESLKKKRNKLLGKIKKSKDSNETLQEKYQQCYSDLVESRENLFTLEETIVPFLLSIPCEIEPSILNEPEIIDQFKNNTVGQISHNYVRLGYLNNLYTRSIVGPGANYLHGEGALLYYGLIDMFSQSLNESGHILVNGLDLVKSAIIECVNYRSFREDLFRLCLASNQSEDNQRLHLVGDASLESFCAWLTKQKIDRGKFYQTGSAYNHCDSIEQNHLIRATILSSANESSKVMNDLYKLFWNIFKTIGIDRCTIRTDIQSLYPNEYDKYILLSWLKSRQEWIPIGEIIHHHHYITQRLGMSNYQDCHLITSSINLIPLLYSIVEQFQIFETGKLDIPESIRKYLICEKN